MKLTKLETSPFIKVDTSVGTHVTAGGVTIFGDTGIRTLTSWDADGNITYGTLPVGVVPSPGYSGGIYIRRVGQRVTMYMIAANSTSTTASIPIPEGFKVQYAPFPYANLNPVKGNMIALANVGAHALFLSGLVAGAALAGEASSSYASNIAWECTQSWPRSLPGIPR